MACEFCKSPDLSHTIYERGYEPGIQVYIVGGTLHIDSVGTKADGIMHSKDIKINYCPVCGRDLKEIDIVEFMSNVLKEMKPKEFVECDGETLEVERSGKSRWSYSPEDGCVKEVDLDNVDISREIEILNKYAREHGFEEGKFNV